MSQLSQGREFGQGPAPGSRGEVFEATGDLELGCAGCHASIDSHETVAVWNVGGFILVAHIDCASPKVRLRAPFIADGGL